MKIGVMIAMQKEFDIYTECLQQLSEQTIANRRFLSGKWQQHDIVVVVSGMGKVNAAVCATCLINVFQVDFIVNIGVSGGLNSSLKIGEFVVGTDVVYHDVWCGEPDVDGQIAGMPLLYHSDEKFVQRLPDCRRGLLCCGDRFIVSADELKTIKQKFPEALAVDMESAAIAHTCYMHNVPFLTVRQISDTPGVEHHKEQYDAFWESAPKNSFSMFVNILNVLQNN